MGRRPSGRGRGRPGSVDRGPPHVARRDPPRGPVACEPGAGRRGRRRSRGAYVAARRPGEEKGEEDEPLRRRLWRCSAALPGERRRDEGGCGHRGLEEEEGKRANDLDRTAKPDGALCWAAATR